MHFKSNYTHLYKIILIGLGFSTLVLFGGSKESIFLILILASLAFIGVEWISKLANTEIKKKISLYAVPTCFLIIVILNLTGWIGTLTGASSGNQNFALLLAAPFYLLSIAAYFSDAIAGKIKKISFLNYLLYISLPFKLLAGPLEPPALIKQIEALKPRFRNTYILVAWPWVVLGVFMKFVIANRLNPAANLHLTDPISALLTASVFEIKFYFDFAGYSFIAYGLALASGLKINHNFDHPFFAANVVLFWRRWHMSLGRFLSRYILEPNLKFIKTRSGKEVFASSIFIVSAMWHGGTVNYLFWGIFHAICYYSYIKYLKKIRFKNITSVSSMLAFFVLGRFLATEANTDRLFEKIKNILSMNYYIEYIVNPKLNYIFQSFELKALSLFTLFLLLEAYTLHRYTNNRPYHFFRKPTISIIILIAVICFSVQSGGLLYARI